jgi:hypothetical protein
MIEKNVWKSLQDRAKQSDDRNKLQQKRSKEMMQQRWKTLAGDMHDEMFQDVESAGRHLTHSVANIRICSIDVLVRHWHINPDSPYSEKIRDLAFGDEDTEVRSMAVFGISRCYAGTDDVRIGRQLALLVGDPAAPPRERKAAYCGLFRVRGLPFGGSVSALIQSTRESLRVPEDFDFEFVGSFLDEQRQPSPVDVESWALSQLPPESRECLKKAQSAKAAFKDGSYVDCIQLSTQALAIQPNVPGLLLMRAQAFEKLKRWQDAIVDLTRVIAVMPFASRTYYERGLCYEELGQIVLAKADFERSHKLECE